MGRLRTIMFIGSAALLGIVAGGGSAWLAAGQASWIGEAHSGHWLTNRLVGSQAADPYTRAIVARRGLLALNRSEAIYFQRFVDEEGSPLTERCRYRLEGAGLPARWWAVTLYAEDDYLPRNGANAFSVNADTIQAGPDGRWTALLAPQRPSGGRNWIASGNAGNFLLTLRMYHPTKTASERPEALTLPRVVRLDCRAAA